MYISNLSYSLHYKLYYKLSVRSLCVFWYWVTEHAEGISVLPKPTIKLETVCHISLIDRSSCSQMPGKSQGWTATVVSWSTLLILAARTSLYEPLIAPFYKERTTQQWPKLSRECMVCLPHHLGFSWLKIRAGRNWHPFGDSCDPGRHAVCAAHPWGAIDRVTSYTVFKPHPRMQQQWLVFSPLTRI